VASLSLRRTKWKVLKIENIDLFQALKLGEEQLFAKEQLYFI
jgi:hypothetical protein